MDALSEPVVETNPQQFCSEIMKRLNIQRKSGDFCDVTLKVSGEGDKDGIEMKAHKVVLSSTSPFFYNALRSDMKEKQDGVIRLTEVRKCVMDLVLDYLYTGHVDITRRNVFDLIEVSDYLMLSGLKELSESFLCVNMNSSNCVCAYYCAKKYRCQRLQDKANVYISKNFVSVARSEDFLNLSSEQVEEWISRDDLIVRGEEDVFRAFLKWVERDEGARGEHFYDLFRDVRCVFASRDYLFRVIAENRFVQGDSRCLKLVFNAFRWIAGGRDQCFYEQAPRDCLKNHKEVVVSCGNGGSPLCYDPEDEQWYELAKMQSITVALASTFCHDKLYVVGKGRNDKNLAERYDPALNSWATIEHPDEDTNFIAIATFQGCMYALGGKNSQGKRSNIVQRYNPEANQWQRVAYLCTPRSSVCAVSSDDHLYAIGGMCDGLRISKIAEKFDVETNKWSRIAPLPEPRLDADGVSYRQKLFLFGGKRSTRGCDMYDVEAKQWSLIPSLAAPVHIGHAARLKERVFVLGDRNQREGEPLSNNMSLQVFNVENREWVFCRSKVHVLGKELYQICSARISRRVLEKVPQIMQS